MTERLDFAVTRPHMPTISDNLVQDFVGVKLRHLKQ